MQNCAKSEYAHCAKRERERDFADTFVLSVNKSN